jgi:predicted DNA-binding ribbon-helix-helix protein
VKIINRSIGLDGRKTSVSLEEPFWDGLREIADHENLARSALVRKIAQQGISDNLSSAIRVFVFSHFRTSSSQRKSSGVHGLGIPAAGSDEASGRQSGLAVSRFIYRPANRRRAASITS